MIKRTKIVSYVLIFVMLFSNFAGIQAYAADSDTGPAAGAITSVVQTPWMIRDGEDLKSETKLDINISSGEVETAYAKITVSGKAPYIEAIGRLANGDNTVTVHVLELNNDGDDVTFEIYDNDTGTGNAMAATTETQKKIRHWKVYVAHDMHLDVGYTQTQETLKNTTWPGFLDQANSFIDADPTEAPEITVDSVSGPAVMADPPEDADTITDPAVSTAVTADPAASTDVTADPAVSTDVTADPAASTDEAADPAASTDTTTDPAVNTDEAADPAVSTDEAADPAASMDTAADPAASTDVATDPAASTDVTADPAASTDVTADPAASTDVTADPAAGPTITADSIDGPVLTATINVNDDKFKYPIESSYMLFGAAWNSRNADWIEKVKGNIADGRMSYSSSYFNECFEGVGTEELARFGYYSERFGKDKIGTASSKVLYKSDDPGLSWANVDVMADSGIKYLMMRYNSDSSVWDRSKYPYMFYINGRVPGNRILAYDGPHYGVDEFSFQNGNNTFSSCTTNIMNYQEDSYIGDALITDFTYNAGDNKGINPVVKDNIKAMNAKTDAQGRDYVYPEFISSTIGDFFDYVSENFSSSIPSYKGTIENWWNYGAASTAYETGVNKANHDKLPGAETFATFANIAVENQKYPYENIHNAYENMALYDEHTWGSSGSALDDQWRWKRNTSIASNTLSDNIFSNSLAALSRLIPATGKTIAVYNSLSSSRSDIVKVKQSDLPAHFDITDIDTNKSVIYQKLSDGTVVFMAENVPGLGYKNFKVTSRVSDPVFESSITSSANTLENRFFKITFDNTGSISSILDKQNGNIEMVDSSAPYKLNQFIYYTTKSRSSSVKSANAVKSAVLTPSTADSPVLGTMTADGIPGAGVSSMQRKVILYDSIPRIDFVNDVVKLDSSYSGSQDEEGYFSFPLNISNFMIKDEMPTGDVRPYVDSNIDNPENEQFYTSSADHHTVNRWIDVSNQRDYGITFSPINAPLVEFGQRRSYMFSTTYNPAKPWIYSYVFNNKWYTNFQETQPGPVTFKYSLTSHTGSDWKAGRADLFGKEVTNELQVSIIDGPQAGGGSNRAKGQFIGIDKDNVVLTTAKLAEANGEGIILRFNETKGEDTDVTVDLSWLAPTSAMETDIVENNKTPMELKDHSLTFRISGYGWKTIRLMKGDAPDQITGVTALTDTNGTRVSWNDPGDSSLAYYEVFRSTDSGFTAGTGNYIASVSTSHFYDNQVIPGLANTYYYKVRAVRAGLKGETSEAAQAGTAGAVRDTAAPTAPVLKLDYTYSNRVSVSWRPSTDDFKVKGYRVYRNGAVIRDVAAVLNSDLDNGVKPNTAYRYTVKAYDYAGNLSESSNELSVNVPAMATEYGNVAPEAAVTQSSQYNSDYAGQNAVDNVIGIIDKGEWASAGERTPWIQLNWNSIQSVNKIVLYDRPGGDNVNSGTLSFSDGTTVEVTGIPGDGTGKAVTFDNKDITWVKFFASGGTGSNNGLSEIQVFTTGSWSSGPEGPELPSWDIAAGKTSSASSAYGAGYGVELGNDGDDSTRWASADHSNTAWYKVDLGQSESITDVVINWESAYAVDYTIEVSEDDEAYSTVVTKTGNKSVTTEDTFDKTNARYVRVNMTKGALVLFSLWSIQIGEKKGLTAFNAAAKNKSITLNWGEVPEATGYKVYMSTEPYTSQEMEPVATLENPVCSYEATGLSNDTVYYFTVKANNEDAVIESSAEINSSPVKTVPGVPTDVTAAAGDGQAVVSFTAPADDGGSGITNYILVSTPGGITVSGTQSPITVHGLTNGTSYTFTVKAVNALGSGETSSASNAVTPVAASNGSGPGGGGSSSGQTPVSENTSGTMLINGKAGDIGAITEDTVEGRKLTKLTVDSGKLEQVLQNQGGNAVITLSSEKETDALVCEITGQMLKDMENRQVVFELKTAAQTYTLPASQINIGDVAGQLGEQVDLKDIKVQLTISKPTAEMAKTVEDSAKTSGFTLVAPPAEFTVKCVTKDKSVDVNKFNTYVQRTMAIPDTAKDVITTGVIVDADGTVRPVPTKTVLLGDQYYAVINSLTNSVYAVVQHPAGFNDVEKHWALEAINDMGSRMIINGDDNGSFAPRRDITRAEFATIIVKALGLKPGTGSSPFADVKDSDPYSKYIQTAVEYKLLSGYKNGNFGPKDKITREQAMTIISNAMKVTGLKADLSAAEADQLLAGFKDGTKPQSYARAAIAACVKAGIISGTTNNMIAPQNYVTRAEVAVMARGLLQKSGLI